MVTLQCKVLLAAAVVFTGCAANGGNAAGQDMVPLDDHGAASETPDELLEKQDPITSDGLAGVYEKSGKTGGVYVTEHGSQADVTNEFRWRLELRADRLTTVLECKLTFGEDRKQKTLVAFVQQDARATPQGYETTTDGKDDQSDALTKTACSLDLPHDAWAYCQKDSWGPGYTTVPRSARQCLGRNGPSLVMVHDGQVANAGEKVAN